MILIVRTIICKTYSVLTRISVFEKNCNNCRDENDLPTIHGDFVIILNCIIVVVKLKGN